MACNPENHDRLLRLAQGLLHGVEADAALEHAMGCSSCGRDLDFLGDLTRAVELEAAVAPPEMLAAAVPPGRRLWERRRWLTCVAAAAALVIAGFAGERIFFASRTLSLASLADITPFPFVEGTLRGVGGEERVARFQEAMASYNGHEFATAAALLSSLAAEDPTDYKLQLYLGVSRLQLGRVREGAEALAGPAARAEGLLAERARWYLAMAHLLREDTAAAQQALQEIRDAKGTYRLNAERLLERIAAAAKERNP